MILEYSRNKSKHKYWDFKWDQSLFLKINGNENDFIKKLCDHEFYVWYYNIQVTNQNTNIEELKWDKFLFKKFNESENDFVKMYKKIGK